MMVNVTKDNFLQVSDELCMELKKAEFVAIDLEMTGIRDTTNEGNKNKPSRSDTPEERYRKLRSVPEKYAIIQIGLSLFLQPSDKEKAEKNDEKKDHDSTDNPNLVAVRYTNHHQILPLIHDDTLVLYLRIHSKIFPSLFYVTSFYRCVYLSMDWMNNILYVWNERKIIISIFFHQVTKEGIIKLLQRKTW